MLAQFFHLSPLTCSQFLPVLVDHLGKSFVQYGLQQIEHSIIAFGAEFFIGDQQSPKDAVLYHLTGYFIIMSQQEPYQPIFFLQVASLQELVNGLFWGGVARAK
jgi:hypothetical protein